MQIGFDLDGVISDLDTTLFRLIRHTNFPHKETEERFKQGYFARLHLRANWNPEELIAEDDEYHIITARHSSTDTCITLKWCKKYCPNAKTVNIVGKQGHTWKESADSKAEKINDLGIEVYFEDDPRIVAHLREKCPKTKIIRVGGRIQT
jgi:phage FluMu protein Com